MSGKARNRFSIRVQLTLVIFAAAFAVLLIMSALFIHLQYQQSQEHALQAARTATEVLAQDFVRSVMLDSADSTADMVRKLQAFPEMKNAVFYRHGNAALAWSRDPAARIVPPFRAEADVSVRQGHAEIYTPVTYDGETYGMAYFRISLREFDATFAAFMQRLLVALPALLIISFLLALFFQRFFTRPVARLVHALNAFTESGKCPLDPRDAGSREMQRLFTGLLDMTAQIQSSQRALAKQEEELRVTLESIADGVITVDDQACVRYMNPAAESITGWKARDAIGEPADRVYRIIDEDSGLPLTRHIDETLVSGSVYFDLEHTALLTREGQQLAIQSSIAPIRDNGNRVTGAVIIFQNVTEARELANKLRHQAAHDPLTDLLNRAEFEARVRGYLEELHQDEQHALLYLDLDQFKLINDTSGHAAGDALLRQISLLLRSAVRESDIVARLGGDEFAIFLPYCSPQRAAELGEKIRRQISDFSFRWEDTLFKVGVSIGVVPVTEPCLTANELFASADLACYAAKDLGRNRLHVYQHDDQELIERHGQMHWVSVINNAMRDDQLVLFAQRVVPLAGDEGAAHYEILVRYMDTEGMINFPGSFLPAVERYNLAPEFDRWVIARVLGDEDIAGYLRAHPEARVNINISGLSLAKADELVQEVEGLLRKSSLSPESICFEITETAAIANLADASRFMRTMKKLGIEFALDDFGSGVSSFGYLSNLPVDYLKIDGCFVRDMHRNSINRAMVKAINEIGHVMNIRTVAEFVEEAETFELLKEMGVDFAQGYFLHRPCLAAEIFSDEVVDVVGVNNGLDG